MRRNWQLWARGLLRHIASTAEQHVWQQRVHEAGSLSAQGSGRTLVLELCAGDLGDLLRHAPAHLDEALAKTLVRQLLRGLAHMHGAGAGPRARVMQLLRALCLHGCYAPGACELLPAAE